MNNLLTKKNIEIVKLLKKEDSYLRDIAYKLKISPGKVHSAINLFKNYDLIKEKKEKNRVIISLNKENPLLQNLINIIEERKEEIKIKLKKREKQSHKGQNGIVLVIAGSIDYVGAPALVAMAALKAGCDLAILAAPEKAALVVNSYIPDLITKKLDGDYFKLRHYDDIKGLIEKADVIAIGPGLGRRKETLDSVKRILKLNKPKVVDADAIYAVNLNEIENSIITPHSHEFEVLFNNNYNKNNNLKMISNKIDNEIKNIKNKSYKIKDNILANKNINNEEDINLRINLIQNKLKNNIILFKGPVDKIISKDKIRLNKTGNEGMTKGGTGDILTGIIASLVSQGNSFFDSAYYAAFINGRAGDILKDKLGYGFLASDILDEIPYIMKEM